MTSADLWGQALVVGGGVSHSCAVDAAPQAEASPDAPSTHRAKASPSCIPILEVSGFHGYLEPHADPEHAAHGRVGGAAPLAATLAEQRALSPEALFISGGDFFQGPPISTAFGGKPVIEAMNAMGCTCMTLGNHDFDLGVDVLARRLGEARFPALAANLVDATSGRPIWESDHPLHSVRPYHVQETGGHKVAVVGLMKPETATLTAARNVQGLAWNPLDETLGQLLPDLVNRERPDVVVLHCQEIHKSPALLESAHKILEEAFPGQELPTLVFMGGHGNPRFAQPIVNGDGLIVQGSDRGVAVNVTRLEVGTPGHRHLKVQHEMVPVLESRGADATVAAIVDRYRDALGTAFSRPVGTALAPFGRARYQDSALGNLVTEAMRERMQGDVAFIPGNSLKADLPQGALTMRNMVEAIPFESHLSRVKMSGNQVLQVLERSAALHDGNRVLQVAGLRMVYDTTLEPGKRVTQAEIGGRPLDPRTIYRVVVDDFLADGGDGYVEFAGCPRRDADERLRDVVQEFVAQKAVITPCVDGRIQSSGSGPRLPQGVTGYRSEIADLDGSQPHTLQNLPLYLDDNLGPRTMEAVRHGQERVFICVGEGQEALQRARDMGWTIGDRVEKPVGFHQVYNVTTATGERAFMVTRVNGDDRVLHIQSLFKLGGLAAGRMVTLGESSTFKETYLRAFERLGPKPDAVVYGMTKPSLEALLKAGSAPNPTALAAYEQWYGQQREKQKQNSGHDLDGLSVHAVGLENGRRVWFLPPIYGDLSRDMAQALTEYGVKDVTFLSTAGAVNPDLHVRDVVTPQVLRHEDGTTESLDWLKPLAGAREQGTYAHVRTPNLETRAWEQEQRSAGVDLIEVELPYWLEEMHKHPDVSFRVGAVITDVLGGAEASDMTRWGWKDAQAMQAPIRGMLKGILGLQHDSDFAVASYQVGSLRVK